MYPGVRGGRVNSIHHQSVKKLGRNLVVEAWSEPDRVVEAMRWQGRGWSPLCHLNFCEKPSL